MPNCRGRPCCATSASRWALSAETSAYAVHEIVCENMASAARVHAVERGDVVGEHTLIAFGGAAPLHAARVAEKIGVSPRDRAVRMPASARRSGFSPRRSPTSWCAAAHAGSMLSMSARCPTLLDEMATEARALVEPGAARCAGDANGAPPSCAMSARATRSRSSCRTGGLTAADLAGLRETFETDYAALVRAVRSRAPRSRS